MSLTFPKVFLLLCAAWSVYALWVVPYQNGLLTALLDLQKPGSYLPGSAMVPVNHKYTGIKFLDNQLVTMIGRHSTVPEQISRS
jgi:hypothetical protein